MPSKLGCMPNKYKGRRTIPAPFVVSCQVSEMLLGNSTGVDQRVKFVMEAIELFENAMIWLQNHYADFRFYYERDIVWTVQIRISGEIEQHDLPYRVFNDFPIMPGNGRSISADLAILAPDGSVEVAAEFKYEPSHNRRADRGGDIWPSKLNPSVVFWNGEGSVEKDIQRVQDFVKQGKSKMAYSVFIDEGGHFRDRKAPQGNKWLDWGQGIWVLGSHVGGGRGNNPSTPRR